MTTSALKILKASAGSGKTYSLVQEYLSIVLKNDNDHAFSRIMAMTFTNKASTEMKERVLTALLKLAYPEQENKRFIDDTCRELSLDPKEAQFKAKKTLKLILHNFSDFSIQTIDKFNIRLVRSFTRDLDLPGDFEIILDTEELLSKTIDKLIDHIGEKGKEHISKLLIEFAKYNVEEEKSWDFKRSLLAFMKITEKEEFIDVLEKIERTQFSKEDHDKLYAQMHAIEREFEELRNGIFNQMKRDEISSEDFKTGLHHIHGRLIKLPSQPISKIEALSDKMVIALFKELETPRTKLPTEFVQKIIDFYAWLANNKDQYLVVKYSYDSFYLLSLLKHITSILKEIRKRENLLQISEINGLISELIQAESAAFIYERIGTRFDHYLLDEFQDTSRLQWLNLIPLLEDSIGNGNQNLIVGDAKQAIYRFRNGLVEQFAALPKIYNPDNNQELERKSAFFEKMSVSRPLKDNYRSKKEVVEFNNMLFENMADFLAPDYQSYYNSEDLVQNPKGDEGGWVKFHISSQTKEDELDMDELELQFIDEAISEIVGDGYSLGDVCLLGRTNPDCEKWANHLIKKGFRVISDEGMKVSQSSHVKLMVACLDYRKNPLSETYQLLLAESYYLAKKEDSFSSLAPYMTEKTFDFHAFMEMEFGSKSALLFAYENLYDFSQNLLRLLDFDELDDPYVHFFCNMLLQFDLSFGPDLSKFIEYYHEKGYKQNVPLPEQENAVTIMTTHKSKGLEFPVVLLPNLKWSYRVKPFDTYIFDDIENDAIYIGTVNKSGTQKQAEVYERKLQANLLDETNLFYVACTRAVDRLYGNITLGKKPSSELGLFIIQALENMSGKLNKLDEHTFIYGSRTFTPHPKKQHASFKPIVKSERLWFPDISLIDKDSIDDLDISDERLFGTDLHRVMQEINSTDDTEEIINNLAQSGRIQHSSKQRITQQINQLFKNEEITTIILPNKGEQVLNEREILVSKKERIRPDRVIIAGKNARIIDYKTGIPREKDKKQLRNYASALKSIGYDKCEAYLLYTDQVKLIQIS